MKNIVGGSEFFRFSLKERNSIFKLLGLLSIVVFIYILSFYYKPEPKYVLSALPTLAKDTLKSKKDFYNGENQFEAIEVVVGSFDPNSISVEELIKRGVHKKVAGTWVKYLSKGGRFYRPEDVLKVYGIHEALYLRLKPYMIFNYKKSARSLSAIIEPNLPLEKIDPNLATYEQLTSIGLPSVTTATLINFRKSGMVFQKLEDLKKVNSMNDSILNMVKNYFLFPEVIIQATTQKPTIEFNRGIKIDLNTADTIDLKKLKGIGSKLANRIVKFRDQLHGFYTTEQLYEVYGMPDSTIQSIKTYLFLSPITHKIEVNHVDLTKIYHPYFNKKDAQIIQNYISQHKPILSIEDLKKSLAFDEKYWDKLAPYLDFSE